MIKINNTTRKPLEKFSMWPGKQEYYKILNNPNKDKRQKRKTLTIQSKI